MADRETERTFKKVKNDLRRTLRDAQKGMREIRQWLNETKRHDAEQDHAARVISQLHRIERLAAHALATAPDDLEDALIDWNEYFPAIEFIAERSDGADPAVQIFTVPDVSPRPLRRVA